MPTEVQIYQNATIVPDDLSTGGPTWDASGYLTATGFNGTLTGNVTGDVTGNVTGDVTGSSESCNGNASTVTNGFYTTSSFNLGTTSIAVNRASAAQTLTGVNIDGSSGSCTGNAATVTNGVYTTSFDGSLTANGYQKLPGGLIMQWGTSSSLGQQGEYQAFATAFTSSVFTIQVTPNGGGGNAGNKRDHWVANSWTLNGFTLTSYFESGSASYSWLAIGL